MPRRWLIPFVVTVCLLAAGDGATFAEPAASIPPDEVLVRSGAVIGEVYIRTGDIFDPTREEEDNFLFNLANRIHVTTRARVIEQKILFREGDPYDPRVLQETARYLRSLDYLYDATVQPIRYHGNRVDVLVATRDVWTLGAGVGIQRSGGENSFQVNLEESNFLGSGRFLDVKLSDDPDRRSQRLRFVDGALFGSRAELRLWYADNSDGHRRVLDLERPFFSFDSRWSAALVALSDDRQEKLYSRGEVFERFGHERTLVELRGGLSPGFSGGRARRWLFGYTYEADRFRANDETSVGFAPPVDRTLSTLWVGFESVEDGYVETRNMDQIFRTEDFNLGTELRGRIGWSSPTWGGDVDRAIIDFRVRSGFAPGRRHTLLLSGRAGGRWGSEGHEDVTVGGDVRYFLRTFGQHQLQIALHLDAAWNLDPEHQLLLGGDNGLRGYPLRYQDGDRRFLLTLEHRFYTDWEIFNLVHAGAAVFVDAGRAWYTGEGGGHGVLTDVGFGLRLSSSRSAKGRMVHLDVAFPLDGDSDEIQWLVTSRETF